MGRLRTVSILLALALLGAGAARAAEITFQPSEVNVGQGSAAATPIDGDEWLSFGIDIVGGTTFVYGPPNIDPFIPPADDLLDNNGIFEGSAPSYEIVFVTPVTGLEIDWWTQGIPPQSSTFTAYAPGGALIEQKTNTGVPPFETESFGSALVARVVVAADPETIGVANVRWEDPDAVPAAPTAALAAGVLVLLAALAVLPAWRARRRGARVTSS
jgi:hypothetical protein